MGSRGPLAKSQNPALGNPGKRFRPAPVAALTGPIKPPSPPRHLGRRGRAAWRSCWKAGATWLSPATDSEVVARYCRLLEEQDELLGLIAQTGRTSVGSMGQVVSHPFVDQLRAVEDRTLKLEAALGLSPLYRARLGIAVATAGKEKTQLDRLLAERQAS